MTKEPDKAEKIYGTGVIERFVNWISAFYKTPLRIGRGGDFTDIYFLENCPKCGEPMKYLRKIQPGELYTCFNCYKSWIKKNQTFSETKLATK